MSSFFGTARVLAPALVAVGAAVTAVAIVVTGSTTATAGPAAADPAATVTVSGTGGVSAAPDMLMATLALSHTAGDVSTALAEANQAVRRVRDSLRANGVSDGDVRTTALQVNGSGPRAKRYHASQAMVVTLRELDRAGRIIADAAGAGGDATRIDGIEFTLSDRTALIERARHAAFADAKAKAQQQAALAGSALGRVRSIREGVGYSRVSGADAASAGRSVSGDTGAAAAAPVPISPGRERTSVRATVVWDLR